MDQAKMRNWIVLVGIVIVIIMGIFPPFRLTSERTEKYYSTTIKVHYNYSAGYYFLLDPPQYSPQRRVDSGEFVIDFSRLGLQWAIVGISVGGLLYIVRDKK